jgi:hypothetical protein
MPVRNDADDGTIYTTGRPRPTLTIETIAFATSGVSALAFACVLARCGASPVGSIGLAAAIATFGLLAYDLSRKRKGPKGRKPRVLQAASLAPNTTPDLTAYDFDPAVKLSPKEEHPLPPDFDSDCIVVFYDEEETTIQAWIGGVADSTCTVRYVNNPNKNAASDPDHLAVSP